MIFFHAISYEGKTIVALCGASKPNVTIKENLIVCEKCRKIKGLKPLSKDDSTVEL